MHELTADVKHPLHNSAGEEIRTLQHYCAHIRGVGYGGTRHELQMLANHFRVNFTVIVDQYGSAADHSVPCTPQPPTIIRSILYRPRTQHFVALLPAEASLPKAVGTNDRPDIQSQRADDEALAFTLWRDELMDLARRHATKDATAAASGSGRRSFQAPRAGQPSSSVQLNPAIAAGATAAAAAAVGYTNGGYPNYVVCFDSEGILRLQNEYFEVEAEAAARKLDVSNVISMMGGTQAGKSTILNLLRGADGKRVYNMHTHSQPAVAEADQIRSTTANVQAYHLQVAENEHWTLLDMEGSRGTLPRELKQAQSQSDASVTVDQLCNNQTTRRYKVSEQLPRLAYLSSDLIVFITTKTFADYEFMEQALELAKRSTHNVESNEKPAVLFIQNQVTVNNLNDVKWQPAAIKAQLEEAYEDELSALECYFSVCSFIRFPHGASTALQSNPEFWDTQAAALQSYVADLLHQQRVLRRQHGDIYPATVWWDLFGRVVHGFQQPSIRMAPLLVRVLCPPEDLLKHVLDRVCLIADRPRRSIAFARASEYLAFMLASAFALRLRRAEKEFGLTVSQSEKKRQETKQELMRLYDIGVDSLRRITPCAATTSLPSAGSVACTTDSISHAPDHHFSQEYAHKYIRSLKQPNSILRGLSALRDSILGDKKRGMGCWPGQFEEPPEVQRAMQRCRPVDIFDELLADSAVHTLALFGAASALRLDDGYIALALPNDGVCSICVLPLDTDRLQRCGHRVCRACVADCSEVDSLSRQQGVAQPAGSLLHSLFDGDLQVRDIHCNFCPLCSQNKCVLAREP